MTTEPMTRRYEMVNVRPGYLMIEQENHTSPGAPTSWPNRPALGGIPRGRSVLEAPGGRSDLPVRRPRHPHRRSRALRRAGGAAVLRLLREGQHRLPDGDLAHDQRVSLYVAITTKGEEGHVPMPLEKVRVLNALFNERLTAPKKVLILPDLFGLHREIMYQQIAVDFGLTSME